MKRLITELILGYQFWTLFQALAPMIWFYPLNELELSGYEAYAIVLFSPLLFFIPFFQSLSKNKFIFTVFRFGSLIGILSFQADTTFNRLIVLCLGCFFQMLVFSISIDKSNFISRKYAQFSLLLGLMLFVVSRIWLTSFVPAWWNNTCNSIVFTFAFIANISSAIYAENESIENKKFVDNRECKSSICCLKVGLGLGCLMYTTQAICSEVSIISRWTVQGYPSTGPSPYPWGLLVLAFFTLGCYMSACPHIVHSCIWWIIGCLSFFGLYYLQTWVAFIAGLILTTFVTSIWPMMISNVSRTKQIFKTVSMSVFVWLFLMLYSVWTVAYNFVPGGVYTREKTGLLIAFVSIGFLISFREIANHKHLILPLNKEIQAINNKANYLMIIIFLMGAAGFLCRYPPNQKFNHQLREGWPSMERAAIMLEEAGLDVITLLESDASKPFLGNNDLGMWLGERLKMHVDFGPSTRDHTWGNLLLSKYPIVKSVHHLLPSPYGELAPAITATVNMSGELVDFVVTHMGNDRDAVDRKLQAQFLAAELKQASNPVVFLGYITSAPFSRDYNELTKQGNVKDIDSTDLDRWCEYIMYRGLKRLGYARLSHGGLSDTEVQMARFLIPPKIWEDNDKITTNHNEVDENIRFSSKFGFHSKGHNWQEIHRYHMGTPKYFV